MERVQTTIRIPSEMLERLRQAARERNISLNQLLTMLLRQELQ